MTIAQRWGRQLDFGAGRGGPDRAPGLRLATASAPGMSPLESIGWTSTGPLDRFSDCSLRARGARVAAPARLGDRGRWGQGVPAKKEGVARKARGYKE